jgi:hypothetical protein
MFGKGTPREAASARSVVSFVIQTDSALAIAVISAIDGETPMLVIIIAHDAPDQKATSSPGSYGRGSARSRRGRPPKAGRS